MKKKLIYVTPLIFDEFEFEAADIWRCSVKLTCRLRIQFDFYFIIIAFAEKFISELRIIIKVFFCERQISLWSGNGNRIDVIRQRAHKFIPDNNVYDCYRAVVGLVNVGDRALDGNIFFFDC